MKNTIIKQMTMPILTKKKCFYCGSKLYVVPDYDNKHWCSNSKCPKGLPFGLNKNNKE